MQHLGCPESSCGSPPFLKDQRVGQTLLDSGQTVQQIMRKHQRHPAAARDAGVSVAREAVVKPQDVRNRENVLADSV